MGGLLCTYSKIELLIVELKIRDLCVVVRPHPCHFLRAIRVRDFCAESAVNKAPPEDGHRKAPSGLKGGLGIVAARLGC